MNDVNSATSTATSSPRAPGGLLHLAAMGAVSA